jgi:hypothetical protein
MVDLAEQDLDLFCKLEMAATVVNAGDQTLEASRSGMNAAISIWRFESTGNGPGRRRRRFLWLWDCSTAGYAKCTRSELVRAIGFRCSSSFSLATVWSSSSGV